MVRESRDVNHRFETRCIKWWSASDVVTGNKVPLEVKEKIYYTNIRPTIFSETKYLIVKC